MLLSEERTKSLLKSAVSIHLIGTKHVGSIGELMVNGILADSKEEGFMRLKQARAEFVHLKEFTEAMDNLIRIAESEIDQEGKSK